MNKIIVAIFIIVVVVLGGYFLFTGSYQSQPAAPPELNQQPVSRQSPTQTQITEVTPSVEQNVVTYTDSGYFPNTLMVKASTIVTFKNESSRSMWTASAVHPSHRLYSGTGLDEHCPDVGGTAFDACTGIQPGSSWSFTFTKVGTWKYHNHLSPSDTGAVIVE